MTFDWLTDFSTTGEGTRLCCENLGGLPSGNEGQGLHRRRHGSSSTDCCDVARKLPAGKVYHPDQAPLLPLPDCPQGHRCGCVYRPGDDLSTGEEG